MYVSRVSKIRIFTLNLHSAVFVFVKALDLNFGLSFGSSA